MICIWICAGVNGPVITAWEAGVAKTLSHFSVTALGNSVRLDETGLAVIFMVVQSSRKIFVALLWVFSSSSSFLS